jgi:hypothetical protein
VTAMPMPGRLASSTFYRPAGAETKTRLILVHCAGIIHSACVILAKRGGAYHYLDSGGYLSFAEKIRTTLQRYAQMIGKDYRRQI